LSPYLEIKECRERTYFLDENDKLVRGKIDHTSISIFGTITNSNHRKTEVLEITITPLPPTLWKKHYNGEEMWKKKERNKGHGGGRNKSK
jgi:hypothetical protein